MKKLFCFVFALAFTLGLLFTVGKSVLVDIGQAKPLAKRSPASPITNATATAIVSISVCSPDSLSGTLDQGSCGLGTFDTHQLVLGPGGQSVNSSPALGGGIGVVPDEHSTVFGPNTLDANADYLFFLSTGLGGNAHIGVSVLSGGAGPDQNGQWTLKLPKADGYGAYSGGFGPVFNPSTKGSQCPAAPNGDPTLQDQTFDMHYASAGSIVKDPTAAPGSMLMVYEGTNACIGNPGGDAFGDNDDYISLAIATSLDYGKTWPTYRGTHFFDFVPLPDVNQTQAPNAPMGKVWPMVCFGNDCNRGNDGITPAPRFYGRYPVVTPTTSLDTLMKAGVPLTSKYGEQEISGFVDDASPNSTPYLYANSGNVRVARAQLNGGTKQLRFQKWDGQGFNSPGLGGEEVSVLPAGACKHCEGPEQNQYGSSISYVEETQQYLLTFVCVSNGDPEFPKGPDNTTKGAGWFWSTSYDLSDQTQWTPPLEIQGSWSPIDDTGGCPDYKGFYPSFMSLGKSAGHLSLDGYVFYLWGCQPGGTPPPGRRFSSRSFKITTG